MGSLKIMLRRLAAVSALKIKFFGRLFKEVYSLSNAGVYHELV